MPLAPDEAYYWVWSKALAPGYLDHPPMVALWIRAGTTLLGDGALGVRLLAPLSAALGSVLLFRAAEDLVPGRNAGAIAAGLLNATLLFGVGAVTMTPDTPILFFWTATLFALARLTRTADGRWWLLAGAAAGCALASKYTAALLGIAIPVWLAATPNLRPWLRRWHLWAAAALAGTIFLPVVLWNADHDWISFAKQGGRTGAFDPSRAVQFLGELIGGQIALATPIIALLCAAGMLAAVRNWRDPAWTLLAALTAVPAVVFLQHALGDRVQANWPAILYPGAAIAAAGLTGRWRRLIAPGMALGLALTFLAWTQASIAPLALPMRLDPTLLRQGGWDSLATTLDATARRDGATYIASDNYSHAALLARLLPPDLPVYGLEPRWSLFALPDARHLIAGQSGLLVRSARRDDVPDEADWSTIDRLGLLDRARNGMTAETFRLYRVVGRDGATPIAIMPRPNAR